MTDSKQVRPPRLLFWETTKACNLKCKHCRAVPILKPAPDELNEEEALGLIDSAADLGVKIFVFSGGEPLLRPDLLDLIDRVRHHGMEAAIATNGTLLDAAIVQEIHNRRVARVSVSLDGATASVHDTFRGQPGSFGQALDGMKWLDRFMQPFQVNTTVTRQNMHSLGQMIDLAQEVGACAVHLFFLVPVGCGAEIPESERISADEYEDLLQWFADERVRRSIELRATCAPHLQRVERQRKKAADVGDSLKGHPAGMSKGCLAGTGIVFVGSRGGVQPCGYMPLVVGNVRKTKLKRLWRENDLLLGLRSPDSLTGACGKCAFRRVCGGCRARALAISGDVFGDEPMCQWGKETANGGKCGRAQ